MNRLKKYFCVFLAILSLILAVPFTASASSELPINISSVEDDLKAWKIDLSKYPKDSEDDNVRLLHMLEYGYDQKGDFRNYGIYLYVYNPSGVSIANSNENAVEMAVLDVNDNQLRNQKYELELLSVSSSNGKENVFYKFKVKNALSLITVLNNSKRQYKISALEILRSGQELKSYTVATHFIWTGYQSFYNKERSAYSTLYYEKTDMDVIELNLFPATWMSASSDLGKGHHYEVFSVYFAVDNYYLKKYGNLDDETSGLRRVSGEYQEYLVNGLFTDSVDVYGEFNNKLKGKNLFYFHGCEPSVSEWGFKRLKKSYGISDGKLKELLEFSFNFETNEETFAYSGYDIYYDGEGKVKYYSQSEDIINFLSMVHLSSVDYMSSKDFKNAWNLQNKNYLSSYAKTLYDVTTEDGNLNEQIKTYASTRVDEPYNWWNKLWNKELWEDEAGYADIVPIKQVNKVEVLAWNEEAIGKEYFMNAESAKEFKDFVQKNSLKNNTIYVMRFAVRDYYSAEVSISNNKEWKAWPGEHNSFYYERAVFDKFDVLEMEFEDKKGERSILPVAATPITVTGGIIGPNVSNPNDPTADDPKPSVWDLFWEWFNKLSIGLKIAIAVVLIVFLLACIRGIWNLVGWLIVGIGNGIAKIFGFTERRVDKHRERKEHKEDRAWKREEEERKRASERRDSEKHEYDKKERAQRYEQSAREHSWRQRDRADVEKRRKESESNRKTDEALRLFNSKLEVERAHKKILEDGKANKNHKSKKTKSKKKGNKK